jgi:hypothetical protein
MPDEVAPYEPERQLRKVWWFLSLDLTSSFFPDLWVPIADAGSFQQKLRSAIGKIDDHQLYGMPGEMNARVQAWLLDAYPTDRVQLLMLWARRVYEYSSPQGSSRYPETLWSWVVAELCRQQPVKDLSLAMVLTNIQQSHIDSMDAMQARIEAITSITTWDSNLLPVLGSSEALINTLRLILSNNAFVSSWQLHGKSLTPDHLKVLTEFASKSMRLSSGVSFPGSWILDLLPFL